VTTTIKLHPKDDYRQKVIYTNIITEPEAKVEKSNDIILKWSTPKQSPLSYNYQVKVKTSTNMKKIIKNPPFPLELEDDSLLQYIRPTQYIDITTEIIKQSNEIIKNETDQYIIAVKLAEWVKNNIKYDLNSLTEEVVQSASWVLDHKEGVCDELTNLYIALLRSQAIPARFVSGSVYSGVDNLWSLHGWAEVYFPNTGWIPFDPTFGQYGWIDSTHLQLSEGADPGESSVTYHWVARNIDLLPDKLNIETKLSKLGEQVKPIIKLEIIPLIKKVDIGSYVPIQVTVINSENYYISPEVHLTKAPSILSTNSQAIPLKPKESKNIYWIVAIPQDLNEFSDYKTIIEVDSIFSEPVDTDIEISKKNPKITEKQAKERIKQLTKNINNVYYNSVNTLCTLDKEYYYKEDTIQVDCNILNDGNTNLDQLKVCITPDNCDVFDLKLSETKKVSFKTHPAKKLSIKMNNDKFLRYHFITPELIEKPEIEIINITPNKFKYKEDVELTLILRSKEEVSNLTIFFNDIGVLSTNKLYKEETKFTLNTNTKQLINGLNIEFDYLDKKGEEYHKKVNIPIEVEGIPEMIKLLNKIALLLYN